MTQAEEFHIIDLLSLPELYLRPFLHELLAHGGVKAVQSERRALREAGDLIRD